MRKDAGFEVTDRINVFYTSNNEDILNAFTCDDELKNVVLADNLSNSEGEGFTKELDINGVKCIVSVSKVK